MPNNNEPITTKFDLFDTVGYYIVSKTLDEVTYQTPFGWPYDYYTNTTKGEIKVRNRAYDTLDVEYSKCSELYLQEYEDRKKGVDCTYLIHYVIKNENTMYTIDLHSIIDNHTYEAVEWPTTTVGDQRTKTKVVYKIPINEWKSSYCDCSAYDDLIIRGMKKYNIK